MNRYMYFRQQEKNDELYHHGIKGQKWGIRRYQNEDGTLTEAGKRRYGRFSKFEVKSLDIKDNLKGIKDLKEQRDEIDEKIWDTISDELDARKLDNKGLNKLLDEYDKNDYKNLFENIDDENFMKQCLPKTNEVVKESVKKDMEYKTKLRDSITNTVNLVGDRHVDEIKNKYKKELGILPYLKNISDEKTNYDTEVNSILDTIVEGYEFDMYRDAYFDKKHPIKKEGKDAMSTSSLLDSMKNKNDPEYKNNLNRAKKDADLGLKALNKIGRSGYDEDKGITGNDREWFIFEDQTIGQFAVCDLINQGKTKAQVKSLVRQAFYIPNEEIDTNTKQGKLIWELKEFSWNDTRDNEFIDACFEIKNGKK